MVCGQLQLQPVLGFLIALVANRRALCAELEARARVLGDLNARRKRIELSIASVATHHELE